LSSSISGSDAVGSSAAADVLASRQWLRTFLTVAAAGFFGAAAFIVAADPYDTGRLALLRVGGVVDERPAFASASRSRDPGFDAAVIGNSHAELLDPERLSNLTGWKFVQLSVSGTSVAEQEATARSFLGHHEGKPVTALFVLDDYWCAPQPPEGAFPFPFWLYGNVWSYLANVISVDGFSKAWSRVELALRLKMPTRRDGYANYELTKQWDAAAAALRVAGIPPWESSDIGAALPGIDVLRDLSGLASSGSHFILLWTPVHANALPAPGSPAERRFDECKRGFAALALAHPFMTIIDWRVRGHVASNVQNFWDKTHYRGAVARDLEVAVAGALPR